MKPYGQSRTYSCGRVIKCRNGGKVHFEIGLGATSKAKERRVGRMIMHDLANIGYPGLIPGHASKQFS